MKHKKILIVDDDIFTLNLMVKFIEENYDVIKASSGDECLEVLKTDKPDMILMDIDMPRMDGFETRKRIMESDGTKDIPIVFLTSIDEEETEVKALSTGVVDYIKKPVGKQVLLFRLQKFFASLDAKYVDLLDEEKLSAIEDPLTEKEMEVVRLMAKFYSNVEISEMLKISIQDTKMLVASIKSKLELSRSSDIRRYFTSAEKIFDRANFLSEVLKFSMKAAEPDDVINYALEYMGSVLGADRVYVFEKNEKGLMDNTYEWCKYGVAPNKEDLKNLRAEIWIDQFRKNKFVYIENLEEYRQSHPEMGDMRFMQNIRSLIAGPIIVDDDYVGYFGLNNPPANKMEDIMEIVKLLPYVFSLMMKFKISTNVLQKQIREDAMTGLYNRRSYYEIAEKKEHSENLIMISFDLNGLKRANDTMGHAAGDELIKESAAVIKRSFEKYGDVFRMGGDEFCAIVNAEKETFERLLEAFDQEVEGWHGSLVDSMSISYGYAARWEFPEAAVSDLVATADKRMYENKSEFYRSAGFDRRRR